MYNRESITDEQLQELMKKADELNAFIKEMTRKNRLVDYAKLRPLSTPRNMQDGVPVFGYCGLYNQEAWNCFCNLAKLLHEENSEFYMSTTFPRSGVKYIRSTYTQRKSRFDNLTNKQMQLSGQMVDEMIAIFNKYFIATHKNVIYDPKDGTGKVICPVLPPTDEEYTGGTHERITNF